ncbi:MAG TPA: PAS domain-containing sensor histidine kinase [Ktedonobacteraceae bacterium]
MNNQSQPNTPHAGHGLSETDPLKPPLQGRRFTRNAWHSLRYWIRANTFAPSWLPPPLRHPVLGYLAAVMLEVIAVALTLLLIADMPAYSLPVLLVVLAVVLVALNWGGGPSLLATLVGGALLDFVVFPSRFGWSFATATDVIRVVLVLVVGLLISLVAGHVARTASQARQEAEAQAAQLRTIFETLVDGVFVSDQEGHIIQHNSAARTILGLDQIPNFTSWSLAERLAQFATSDAQGRPLTVEQAPPSRNLRGEVLTGEAAQEVWVQTLDGRKVLLSITGAPTRNRQGQITGAVWLARDVTERRRLELYTQEALDALLAMAEVLVQGPKAAELADLSSVQRPRTDTDPALLAVAQRLATLTRRVLECQYVGMAAVEPGTGALTPITVVGLAPEDEQRWWASWDKHAYLGQYLPPSLVAKLRAGEPVLLDQTQSPLPIWHGPSPERMSFLVPMQIGETLVGILRMNAGAKEQASRNPNKGAVTIGIARLGALVLEHERLLRERAEAQANELALREAQAQMDTFLAIVSHELKTPLTYIKLNLQLTQRRLEKLVGTDASMPEELGQKATLVLEEFAHTDHQVAQLERLVNDVLDVSRVQAGRLDLHPESTDLGAIVREAVGEQRQAAPTHPLLLELPAAQPVPVYADADRVGQVITNYLTNALKYSPAEQLVVVGLDVVSNEARVWVHDQGPGLPPEEQVRIWERFHRVKGIEVQSGNGVGLGLGLYISRTIIERHQGRVGVESAPGQGSTFWFTLPLAPTRQA